MDQSEKNDVLCAEASFQDSRIRANTEPRDAFAYLYQRALDWYWNTLVTISKDKRVLVVGCSEHTVIPISKVSSSVVGIDISPVAIGNLTDKIRVEGLSDRAAAHVMDAECPDFPPESFDVICCSGVLHHLNIESSIRNWHRLLRTNGMLLMMEPMKYNPFAAIYRIFTPSQRTPNEHPLTVTDLNDVKKTFKNAHLQPNSFLTPLSLFAHYLKMELLKIAVFRILQLIDDTLFQFLPGANYLAWSIVISSQKRE